jgi:hypothetical protein
VDRLVETILELRRAPDSLKAMSDSCRATAVEYTRERTGREAALVVADCLRESLRRRQ